MSVSIVPIAGVEICRVEGSWPLPPDFRARVPAMWAEMVAANPHLWDGRVLGVTPPEIDADGVLRAEAQEDAYSAFLAWRAAGFPEIGIRNLFGSALVLSRDGALIFGLMGETTANPGALYPPGGLLEPRDVGADGRVDVAGCALRELHEETGLAAAEARKGALVAVFDGPHVSIAQTYHFDADAEDLVRRIRADLAGQRHRELADVVALRSAAEARAAGNPPRYALALLDAISDDASKPRAGPV